MSTWDDKPNDYEHAVGEIARLQMLLAEKRDAIRHWKTLLNEERAKAIEECARVVQAESSDCWEQEDTAGAIDAQYALIAAIRALKDKPMSDPERIPIKAAPSWVQYIADQEMVLPEELAKAKRNGHGIYRAIKSKTGRFAPFVICYDLETGEATDIIWARTIDPA